MADCCEVKGFCTFGIKPGSSTSFEIWQMAHSEIPNPMVGRVLVIIVELATLCLQNCLNLGPYGALV